LMEVAAKATLESGKVNPELVNGVVIGNVLQVLKYMYYSRSLFCRHRD
jgi:hypothetical protein